MKKAFLDTNVILDSVIPTRNNYTIANAILSACDYGEIKGCVSFLTVANAAYILKKGRSERDMVDVLRESLEGMEVLPMGNDQLQKAYSVEAPDFEDVLQYECAKAAGCEVIVTGNVRHFGFCKDIEIASTYSFAQQFTE